MNTLRYATLLALVVFADLVSGGVQAQGMPTAHWCEGTPKTANFLYCWGGANLGRLGNGTTTPDRTTPDIVRGQFGGFDNWSAVSSGKAFSSHTCGIRAGEAFCWGTATSGRLGNGTTTPNRTTPSLVLGGWSDWTAISAGGAHTCGIRAGQAYCWGTSASGRLGNGTTTPNRTTPSLVLGGWSDWTAIVASEVNTCGIRAGQAYCWGSAFDGQLGNGTTTPNRTTPSLVLGGWSDWTAISQATQTTCGIRAGQAYCWGVGSNGDAGNNNSDPTNSPSLVLGGWSDWTAISAGTYFTCGIRAGQAYCWGGVNNNRGQLGDGSTSIFRPTPTLVLGGWSDWTEISAGGELTCGIRAGQTYCWGESDNGRLGNGTITPDITTPTLVLNNLPSPTSISVGSIHACVVVSQTLPNPC